MRKSSMTGRPSTTGRPSVGGIPLRVRQDNAASGNPGARQSAKKPSEIKSRSLSFGQQSGASISGASSFKAGASARQSFIPKTGRPSSGIGVRGRTDVPKDPRPLSDKKYQHDSIRDLLEFLNTNNYPHPISPTLLKSPTSKDFFKIFSFIYSKLDPGYTSCLKMEEEVPKVLRMIGYPFTFSKTYLYSVGSPHTWPHLLGALMWMITLIQTVNEIPNLGGIDAFIFGDTSDDFDDRKKSDDQIAFEYCSNTYAAYMDGADTFEDYDEDLRRMLRQNLQGENIDTLIEQIHKYEAELELIAEEDDSLQKTLEKIETFKHDNQQIRSYLEQLAVFKTEQIALKNGHEEDLKMLESQHEVEKERLKELQMIHENQDLSQGDVDRMKAEQSRLRGQVEQLESQVEAIESDNWKVSMEIGQINEKVEKEVAAYNRLAIQLKLVPETAELANGEDFRLKAGYNSNVVADFQHKIKPMLKRMKNKSTEEIWRMDKDKFQLSCEVEKFKEQMTERQERLDKKEKELQNMESELSSLKQVNATDKKSVSSELEMIEETLSKLKAERDTLVADMKVLATENKEAQQHLKITSEAVTKELSRITETRMAMRECLKSQMQNYKVGLVKVADCLKAAHAEESERVERLKKESEERDARIARIAEDPYLSD